MLCSANRGRSIALAADCPLQVELGSQRDAGEGDFEQTRGAVESPWGHHRMSFDQRSLPRIRR